MLAEADADAWLKEALARALEANERQEQTAAELRAENARLREELARRDAELERVNAELAVLQRLVFGRSSERARPGAPAAHRRPSPDLDLPGKRRVRPIPILGLGTHKCRLGTRQ